MSYGDAFKEWKDLLDAVVENAGDLQDLAARRVKLEAILEEAQEISKRQAALTAGRQEASRRLEALLTAGQKVATFLRFGVREFYGNRSEKLAEFRMQPLRGRPRATAPTGPIPEPDEPE
jgi:hypothetical protein